MKLVKYGATWCTNCRLLDKSLENIPHETVDVDEQPEEAEKYNITQIPIIIKFDDSGMPIDRWSWDDGDVKKWLKL